MWLGGGVNTVFLYTTILTGSLENEFFYPWLEDQQFVLPSFLTPDQRQAACANITTSQREEDMLWIGSLIASKASNSSSPEIFLSQRTTAAGSSMFTPSGSMQSAFPVLFSFVLIRTL